MIIIIIIIIIKNISWFVAFVEQRGEGDKKKKGKKKQTCLSVGGTVLTQRAVYLQKRGKKKKKIDQYIKMYYQCILHRLLERYNYYIARPHFFYMRKPHKRSGDAL